MCTYRICRRREREYGLGYRCNVITALCMHIPDDKVYGPARYYGSLPAKCYYYFDCYYYYCKRKYRITGFVQWMYGGKFGGYTSPIACHRHHQQQHQGII